MDWLSKKPKPSGFWKHVENQKKCIEEHLMPSLKMESFDDSNSDTETETFDDSNSEMEYFDNSNLESNTDPKIAKFLETFECNYCSYL